MNIEEIIKNNKKTNFEKSERAEIIKNIYNLYTSKTEKEIRKKDNWKRYILFLKENKIANNEQNQTKFKKDKRFLKELSVARMGYLLSPVPTKDLYYILSVAKDRNTRGQSIGSFIISSIWKIK